MSAIGPEQTSLIALHVPAFRGNSGRAVVPHALGNTEKLNRVRASIADADTPPDAMAVTVHNPPARYVAVGTAVIAVIRTAVIAAIVRGRE